jgi:hypothetical protein
MRKLTEAHGNIATEMTTELDFPEIAASRSTPTGDGLHSQRMQSIQMKLTSESASTSNISTSAVFTTKLPSKSTFATKAQM